MVEAKWLLLVTACAASLLSMAWLALAMDDHWEHVHGRPRARVGSARLLRILGGLGLAISLALCLGADHATIAVLVWLMLVPACAIAVAMALAWRPGWLRLAWGAGARA